MAGHAGPPSTRSTAATPRNSPPPPPSASPARCMVPSSSTPQATRFAPPSSWNDTRAAAECITLERTLPDLRQIAGNIAMPGFTAPQTSLGPRERARPVRADQDRAPAQGLPPPKTLRRVYRGHVRRLRHAVARRRRARLVRCRPCRDLPVAGTHAALGRRQRPRRRPAPRARRPLGHDPAPRSSPPAPGTTPPAPSAWAPSTPATPSSPSAPPASSSPPRRGSAPTRNPPSTPSATRCPTPGTRWASRFPPPPRWPGGRRSPASTRRLCSPNSLPSRRPAKPCSSPTSPANAPRTTTPPAAASSPIYLPAPTGRL